MFVLLFYQMGGKFFFRLPCFCFLGCSTLSSHWDKLPPYWKHPALSIRWAAQEGMGWSGSGRSVQTSARPAVFASIHSAPIWTCDTSRNISACACAYACGGVHTDCFSPHEKLSPTLTAQHAAFNNMRNQLRYSPSSYEEDDAVCVFSKSSCLGLDISFTHITCGNNTLLLTDLECFLL